MRPLPETAGACSFRPPPQPSPTRGEGAAQHPVVVLARPSPCGRGWGRGHSRIMFEIDGVGEDIAREALHLGATKLPMTTRVVIREDW